MSEHSNHATQKSKDDNVWIQKRPSLFILSFSFFHRNLNNFALNSTKVLYINLSGSVQGIRLVLIVINVVMYLF